ncbi:hypothetical protein ACLM5J_05575 [Nocardioides sp. Bht2]|uniref:hypothetical protein n=1 Tax=Nocardioides sp. Bht2 TaxID=3392297 RepID=UPI0039B37818
MNSTVWFRRVMRAAVAGLALGLVAVAVPANANVPEGWSDPESVDPMFFLSLVFFIPLAMAVVIILTVITPGLIRGDKFAHSNAAPDSEWFGGPRSGTDELPAPDSADSKAGGASGQW